MNPTVFKVLKIVVKVAGIAVPLAVGYFENKDLDTQIAEKVKKAVSDALEEKK